MRFVEGCVRRIRVPAGQRDVQVFDDALPGFYIRKFASGKATYGVKFNVGTQQRKLSLGPVVPGVLSQKRRQAAEVLTRARVGQDVVADKKVARVKHSITLGELVPKYLAAKESDLRAATYIEADRYLQRYWKPLHDRAIEAIQRRDIVKVVDDIADEHGKATADRAKAALSAYFAWTIEKGYLDHNPVQKIARRSQSGSRDRVLTEAELVEVWKACEDDDFGRIVRLLILTAQRKREIGDLVWAEIDRDKRQLDLPGERTKNKRPHLIPLSDAALDILAGIHQREGREHVFGDGSRGFQGWSKAKGRLEAKIADARREARLQPMKAWTLHDIRRSVVTHLHESRRDRNRTWSFAQPHVAEAIVNHISGHRSGVAGVYNKAEYLPERQRALDLWGNCITALVLGKSSNVVSLRGAGEVA